MGYHLFRNVLPECNSILGSQLTAAVRARALAPAQNCRRRRPLGSSNPSLTLFGGRSRSRAQSAHVPSPLFCSHNHPLTLRLPLTKKFKHQSIGGNTTLSRALVKGSRSSASRGTRRLMALIKLSVIRCNAIDAGPSRQSRRETPKSRFPAGQGSCGMSPAALSRMPTQGGVPAGVRRAAARRSGPRAQHPLPNRPLLARAAVKNRASLIHLVNLHPDRPPTRCWVPHHIYYDRRPHYSGRSVGQSAG